MAGTELILVDDGVGGVDGVPAAQIGVLLITGSPIQTPADPELKTVAERLDAKASIKHRPVYNTDYKALATDVQIGFVGALTASRIVLLPDVDTYPFSVLYIGDETGLLSLDLTITIRADPAAGDVLAGGEIVLAYPYLGQAFRRGAANLWIPVKS